ncbi:MAG: glycosyltransferase family 1 protein, partial [Candidatus Woesearchaeota archaeon]
MRILMLSWRDLKHPEKGGAEVVTDKYLAGLAKSNEVVLFTAQYKGARSKESFHGYTIIRSRLVYLNGLLYAWKHQAEFD